MPSNTNKKRDKAWVVAWRTPDNIDHGDVTFTYEEAKAYCIALNKEYLHMYHYPLHIEETESNVSEIQ